MEKNKRIIIELYGLPGSGKSTLKNELVKKISEENLNIYEYSDYLNFMSKGHKNAIIKGLFTKNKSPVRFSIKSPNALQPLTNCFSSSAASAVYSSTCAVLSSGARL